MPIKFHLKLKKLDEKYKKKFTSLTDDAADNPVLSGDTVNWIVVSMRPDIASLQRTLRSFPRVEQSDIPSQSENFHNDSIYSDKHNFKFCSASMLCSGFQGNNTRIELFHNYKYGFTVDTDKTNLLVAGKVDIYSDEDTLKDGKVSFLSKYKDPNHPKSEKLVFSNSGFTDISRWDRLKKIFNHEASYYNVAKTLLLRQKKTELLERFSKQAIVTQDELDTFTKQQGLKESPIPLNELNNMLSNPDRLREILYNRRFYNELLISQKGEDNPINGIIINFDCIKMFNKEDISGLKEIFVNNGNFRLFIYDKNLKNNIIREINDKDQIIETLDKLNTLNKKSIAKLPYLNTLKNLNNILLSSNSKIVRLKDKPPWQKRA